MTGRHVLILALTVGFYGTPPAFAHKDKTKPCEPKLVSEELQSQLFARFEMLEERLKDIFRQYEKLPHAFTSEFHLAEKVTIPADHYRAHLDEILSHWEPAEERSTREAEKALTSLEQKTGKLAGEVHLWQDRHFVNKENLLADIRGSRQLILPNRVYEVLSDRGENIRVRFSRNLVEEFFWQNGRDSTSIAAADKALEAIARGFRTGTSGAACGIGVLRSKIGGEPVYVLKFSGHGVGAHRVYGLMKDGIIGFVTHEAESSHDAKYLNRASERAIKAHQAQNW